MKRKNNSEEIEFDLPYDRPENREKTNRLIQLFYRPWSLIKEGGKLGLKSVKRFFVILFLFAFSNLLLFFYALYRLFSTSFEWHKLLLLLLILLLGIGFTIYAGYKTYRYVLVDAMQVVYGNLSSFFYGISEQIIEKTYGFSGGKIDVNKNLHKTLDFGKMVHSKYRKIPKILRKGIILILSKIPFTGILFSLQSDLQKNNNKAEASAKLYHKMDKFISGNIFKKNNTFWLGWLFPLNIIVLILLIKFLIA